jgi:peptidoglycan/LPS O-acetylase OafA/YrhL
MWFAWCCGAFLADKKMLNEGDFKKPVYRIIYALVLVAFIIIQVFDLPQLAIVDYQVKILLWTAPLLFLISKEKWFSNQKSIFIKLLSLIGLSSYSLYLFHAPLIELKNFLGHEYLPSKLQPVGVITGFLIIPAITWLTYKYIEKPFMAKKRNSQTTAYPMTTTPDSQVPM